MANDILSADFAKNDVIKLYNVINEVSEPA